VRFQLIDIIESQTDEEIVACKSVTLAEEYLADHFPTFPILPGVFMLEAMVQAARALLAPRGDGRLVLGEVCALKYGAMVRPGQLLRVRVRLDEALDDGGFRCRGAGTVHRAMSGADSTPGPAADDEGETAVSGRFTMRPIRTV
jgi:3-hydroxyacyl-[acyl-carrier-protein] dehydratase